MKKKKKNSSRENKKKIKNTVLQVNLKTIMEKKPRQYRI